MIRALKILLMALVLVAAPVSLDREVFLGSPVAHAQVEVDLQWHKGFQFLDSNGDPLSAGKVFIQDAGTSSHRVTYADEDGTVQNTFTSNEIILDSAGRFAESVYITVGSWKFTVKDSDDATVYSEDNIEGAHATSTFLTGSSSWTLPVLSKTSDYTVVADDLGKCINADPTGGAFTVTLISAATGGDGKTLCVRHVGTANEVTVATVSAQTIDGHDTFVLSDQYDSVLLVSDGANWHIAAQATPPGSIQFIVADRLTSPPASPTAGAWYIISGTPTGDWATFADEDIVRAAGDGGWHKFTPPTDSGWQAYIIDENIQAQFRDSAWVDWSNITAPTSDALEILVIQDQKTQNTTGGTPVAATWTKHTLDDVVTNTVTGASAASDQVTLPTGEYEFTCTAPGYRSGNSRIRLYNATDAAAVVTSDNIFVPTGAADANTMAVHGYLSVTEATEAVELQYYFSNAAVDGLGQAHNVETEIYATCTFIDLDSLQGPTGATGPQGAQGAAGLSGLSYSFDSSTTMADPGAGDLRLNNATLSSVTAMAIDAGTSDSGNPDVSDYIATWDDSTSTVTGQIRISKASATENIVIYDVSAVTDNTGWLQVTLSFVQSSGSFSNADALKIEFVSNGDKGDTGAAGATGATGADGTDAGHVFTFSADTTTTTDPGTGNFELNNATVASVTEIAVDDQSADAGNPDVSAYVATWDDSTSTTKGFLIIKDVSAPGTFAVFKITAITDATTHHRVSVTHVDSSGTFADDASLQFSTSGDAGAGANSFETMNASSGTDPVADSGTDTLAMTGTAPVVVTGDSAADSLTFSLSGTTAQYNSSLSDGSFATLAGTETLTNKTISGAVIATDLDMNGLELILDADADTSITADTDDQIDIRVSAADDFRVTANTFSVLTGSILNSADTGALQENSVAISPIGQHTVSIPARALTSRTTNGCAAGSTETTTNNVMLESCDFDAATDEFAQFSIKMPKGWNEGTVIVSFDWFANATTGNVIWGAQGVCFADDDPLDTAFGTAQTVTDGAGSAADDNMSSTETSAITLAGAPGAEERCVFQVFRDANAGGDTLAVDAELLEVKLHLTMDAATDD